MSYKTEALTSIISNLSESEILEIVNDYLPYDNPVCRMEDFDDYCEKRLTYSEVAEAVRSGDFRTWDDFFRYDDHYSEFTSGDSIDNVFDYTDDDEFAEWLCGGDFDFDKYGITVSQLIDDYCDYYEINREKLVSHPNWEEHCIIDEDWDELLETLEIEESEVSNDSDDDE